MRPLPKERMYASPTDRFREKNFPNRYKLNTYKYEILEREGKIKSVKLWFEER